MRLHKESIHHHECRRTSPIKCSLSRHLSENQHSREHTKHYKNKPCIYHICNSPNTLGEQKMLLFNLASGRLEHPHRLWVRTPVLYQKHYQHSNPNQDWCRSDLHTLVCLLKCDPFDTPRMSALNSYSWLLAVIFFGRWASPWYRYKSQVYLDSA